MSREWKPGDVAMVAFNDNPAQRAVRSGGVWAFLDSSGYGIDSYVTDARPLVVIDPESHADAQRLADALCAVMCKGEPSWDEARAYEVHSHMRAALMSLADPPTPPKPDEPTGLGAVVEDAEERLYVNVGTAKDKWRHGSIAYNWREIAAVRVLSDAVTP